MMESPRDVCVHLGPGTNLDAGLFLHAASWRIRAFVGRRPEGNDQSVPLFSPDEWASQLSDVPSIVTASDPATRRQIVEYITDAGGNFAHTEPKWAALSRRAVYASTALFCDGVGLGPFARVGEFSIILSPVSIGHDSVIGDFVTCHAAVGISGFVIVGDDVVIETGAVIVNGTAARPLCIGNGAIIRAYAVITHNVPRHAAMAGNPAQSASRTR